jgi:hypothetical protein
VKLTIDSSESLADALRVLGAVYDVTLTVSEKGAVASTRSAAGSGASAPAKVRLGKGRKNHAASSATSASNVEIRSWALQNGMTVSNRGRLPGRVVSAYRDAHQSE